MTNLVLYKNDFKVKTIYVFSPPGEDEESSRCKTFQAAVTQWMLNTKQRLCSQMDKDGIRCLGIRSTSPRSFMMGPPPFVPIELCNCRWNVLPNELDIQGHKYSLTAVTYGNGGHFNSSIFFQGKWYAYDGLQEYHRKGTGLIKQQRPIPRPGYIRNTALYIKNSI